MNHEDTPQSLPPDLCSAQTVIVYINKAFILHPILPFTLNHWVEDIIISLKGKWGRGWNNIYITLRDEGGRDRAVRFARANDFSFFLSLWSGLPITWQWSCVEGGNGSITHLHYCQWGHSGPWFLSSQEEGIDYCQRWCARNRKCPSFVLISSFWSLND